MDNSKTQGTILIAEDDPVLRDIIPDILAYDGYRCVTCKTADDALLYLLQHRAQIDLLITDYQTGSQLNGAELASLAVSRWPELPIILTSSHGSDIAKGLFAQVRYLPKPWRADELLVLIGQLLQALPLATRDELPPTGLAHSITRS
ncbi:response regulator [Azomonas macrocytogenes]|uniref:CheY-like chemotaxis protein n=1 Tax=Azomonas macrocytogenes TaxID=69962 RepID=A0A839SY15_AZOMA|nr:response regulator [Azomonas macrocytogenes]MBB3102002.1 CheY-like chemotaxis protein [Azomonas macrocytogenes]